MNNELIAIKFDYAETYKCLSFMLHQHLNYSLHLKELSRKINHRDLLIIRRVTPFLPTESLNSIANSMFESPGLLLATIVQYHRKSINDLLNLQEQCARDIFYQTDNRGVNHCSYF